MKTAHLRTVLIILTLGLSGCQQHEKPAPPKLDTAQSHTVEKETTIVVPDSVKGKWKAVRIAVVNKTTAKVKIYTIPIGGKITLPGSDMTIAVESFLPSFIMEGSTLTSVNNEMNNPGAKVRITEGETVIFKGWLFSRYPTTHAFMHPKYGFTLTDAVPANHH